MTTELSTRIKARRNELELTQGELALIVGVSRGTIRNVEAGKSMEASTQTNIERVLGWLPGTTEPFIDAFTMGVISRGLLSRMEARKDALQAQADRTVYHAFLREMVKGEVTPTLVDSFAREIISAVPKDQGEAALGNLGIVASERAKLVVRGEMNAALPPLGGTMAGTTEEAPDATEERPEGFRVAKVSGTSSVAFTATAATAAGPVQATRAQPPVVQVATDVHIMVVPISMHSEVLAELDSDNLAWLFDTLQKQGIEMAKQIARAKRAERHKRGFELQDEFPPMGFESRSEWPSMNVGTDKEGDQPGDDS